ncbi:hypothetical protein [Neobacillus cucumis]|uniref:hypothetical protein n=1 Tax=Neobacillus cucumis TaxID=1740721 RepID=UPI002E239F02|nr:hypothetical protein [Neobacillus cucumis]
MWRNYNQQRKGNKQAANGKLQAYENEQSSQREKSIAEQQASILISFQFNSI